MGPWPLRAFLSLLIRAQVRVHHLDVDVVLVSPGVHVGATAREAALRRGLRPRRVIEPPRPIVHAIPPDHVVEVHLHPVVHKPSDERVAKGLLGGVGLPVERGDHDVHAPGLSGATVVRVGSADDPRRLAPDTPYLPARALAPAPGGARVWREVARGPPWEIQAVTHAPHPGDALELGPLVLEALLGLLGELRVPVGALDP